MARDLPKYVHRYKSRHGQERIYFRLGNGHPYTRIHEAPNTPEFFERYAALLKGPPKVGLKKASSVLLASGRKPTPQTFGWLCVQYYKSVDCHLRREKPILDACCKEVIGPNDKRTFGAMPLEVLDLKAVKVLRDRKVKAGMIGSAANRVKALRRLCKWARAEGHLSVNPALELEFIRRRSDGHIPWTDDEEIKRFRKHWPIGTMQRLAFEMMLGCGLAKVDAIEAGPKNVEEFQGQKLLHYRRAKTGVAGFPPMPKELLDAIAAVNLKSTTHFLLTSHGKPFTSSASFGNWFAEACHAAEVDKTPHGLRKNCAIHWAERGVTASQLCRIMAWSSIKEAELYCRAAEGRKMAAMAARLPVE